MIQPYSRLSNRLNMSKLGHFTKNESTKDLSSSHLRQNYEIFTFPEAVPPATPIINGTLLRFGMFLNLLKVDVEL